MNRLSYVTSRRRSTLRIPRSAFRTRSIRPTFLRRADSEPLSPDYAEIIRLERRRAKLLALSILCLLVVAACIYFAQS